MNLDFVHYSSFLIWVKPISCYHFQSSNASSDLVNAQPYLRKSASSNLLPNSVGLSNWTCILEDQVLWLNNQLVQAFDHLRLLSILVI